MKDADLQELNCKFDLHIAETRQKEKEIFAAIEKNNENIDKLAEATQGLVEAWRTLISLQKATKWVAGFAVLIVFFEWVATKIPFLTNLLS